MLPFLPLIRRDKTNKNKTQEPTRDLLVRSWSQTTTRTMHKIGAEKKKGFLFDSFWLKERSTVFGLCECWEKDKDGALTLYVCD